MSLMTSLFLFIRPVQFCFTKYLFAFLFGMQRCIYFNVMFSYFSSHFKGWAVKFWVCVAEGIKRLYSLQVVTAAFTLRSPHRYNHRSHRLHSASAAVLLSQPGCDVFTKVPSVCNILLFDVRVLQVHECISLGCDPWEENLPPCRNVLWKLFKLVLDKGNCHSPQRD